LTGLFKRKFDKDYK